jgi:hypothetical protein
MSSFAQLAERNQIAQRPTPPTADEVSEAAGVSARHDHLGQALLRRRLRLGHVDHTAVRRSGVTDAAPFDILS